MINWDRVFALRDEVGPEGFAEIAGMFLEEVDQVVDSFRTDPDLARLEHDLHFLKGGVLNLGFERLAQLCQNGERLAAEGQGDQVDLAAIVQLYTESRHEFRARLDLARAA